MLENLLKMPLYMQVSIFNAISCYGIGVHSGRATALTLKPAKPDTGIVFVRTDVKSGDNFINASYANVGDTAFSTSIKNSSNVKVSTIEHLMAALWGCGIDNIIVELDGPEVPIMDGSSQPFVFMIECSGRKLQHSARKYLKILKEIQVSHQDSEITARPASALTIDLTIDYHSQAIGKQNFVFSNHQSFNQQIAAARTFGFTSELDYLKSKGLAQGASLENAIGIDQDTVLNLEGLRYHDEFVRHKLLDLVGDLYTAGGHLIGAVTGYKTGHTINHQFLRQLFSDQQAYQWVSASEL